MSKAYSYIRFSSAKQAGGDSYRRQMELAQAYCQQHGLELADSREYLFFDAGRSAFKGRHLDDTGELARFLSYVESGRIPTGSTLLVESLDRLSRENVQTALARFLDLLNKGITVVTLNDGKTYNSGDDFTSLLVSIVYMARAHEESATKGKRVSAAWRNKQALAREQGKPIGKLCPLWLKLGENGDTYIVIPERAEIVRRIFSLSASGYGNRNISMILNQEGIPSFTAGRNGVSGLWGFSGIRQILNNRAVLGEYWPHVFVNGKRVPDGEPIKGYFPAVITEDEWWLAHAAKTSRRGNTEQKPITKTSKNFNVWAGILHCRCGGAMHILGKQEKRYYKCTNKVKGLCNSGMVGAPRAEKVFREVLAKVDSLSLVQDNSSSIAKQISILEGRLGDLKAKHSETEKLHEEIPSRSSAKILAALEAETEQLETEKRILHEQLATDIVTNKEDFFRRLDLVSYEGRVAANNLLKRLHIRVSVWKNDRMHEHYTVSENRGFKPYLLTVEHVQDNISINAYSGTAMNAQLAQGEITKDEFDRMTWEPEDTDDDEGWIQNYDHTH